MAPSLCTEDTLCQKSGIRSLGITRGWPAEGSQHVRHSVKSATVTGPVDAHERTRDYITEDELHALVESTKRSRYRWRDAAVLLLTFYHGLRASEVCHLRRPDVDLTHGRIWIARLKGSLSTEQPLLPQELRALKRYLSQRGEAQLPWLFLTERGDQFTRFTINYLVDSTGKRAGLPVHV